MSENKFEHGFALLIGVGESTYPKWSLPVTVKDAQALRRILTDPNLCAYPDSDDHIRLLDDNSATGTAIMEGLTWLKEQADKDPDATIIVFYSGHGWLEKATGGYYLIPHDIKPFDLSGSALKAGEFTASIRDIQAKRLLVLIDSCHAEGMATAKDEPAIELPSSFTQTALPKGLVDELKKGYGRAVYTSSRGEQRSWIRPDKKLSIYTYHLIEALEGAGNQAGETTVKLSNLMNHLGEAVPESARTLCSAEQTPFFDTAAEDFPVALLRGGKGLPVGGWEPAQHAQPQQIVQATGERSVAIGGSAQGSTIITGNENIVGDRNIRVGSIGNGNVGVSIGHGSRTVVSQNTGSSPDEVVQAFAAIYHAIKAMPASSDKDDAQEAAQKLEAEVRKGDDADEGRVRRLLNTIVDASLAGGEVALNTLISPISGVATLIQKIAERIKEERKRKGS